VAGPLEKLESCTRFQWDAGNAEKSRERHGVSRGECEQVFFNSPLLLAEDKVHSQSEVPYWGLGQTNAGRALFVVFTTRGDLVRVISARNMSRRERKAYEQAEK